MRVDGERNQAGERDARVIERCQAARASNTKKLPGADRRTNCEQSSQRCSAGNDDVESRRSRDNREENSLGEL
jgi:hypothetical protein